MKRFWSRLVVFSLVLALVGCSSGSGSKEPAGGSSSTPAPAPAAPKELVIAQGTDPQTLDPHMSTVMQALNISMAIAEPLATLDYKTGEIKPNLALEWKSINPTTWQVKLRQGVKFTNGEDFTADSVKVSFERIKKPELKSPATAFVGPISKIEVVDPHTVNFVTSAPSPVIPLFITRIGMVPPKYLQEKGDAVLAKEPIGTGPYKLKSWVKDERVVLEANPSYWGGKPTLDTVIFRSIPETASRMAALKTGEADIVTQVTAEEMAGIERAGAKVEKVPGTRLMFVQFNLRQESALKDKRVRQALNYAIDKESIVKNLLNGLGKVVEGQPLSKEYFGYSDKVKAYPFDQAKAKQLLAEAGYGPSKPLEITLNSPQGRYNLDKEVAQAIGGQLQAVGIKANVQVMEWGLFIQKLVAKELTPMMFWGASTPPDADIFMGAMMTTTGAYGHWGNADFDALVKQAGQTIDRAERQKLYEQAAQLAHDEAPLLYLYQQVDTYGVNSRVSGFTASPDERIDLLPITVGAKK